MKWRKLVLLFVVIPLLLYGGVRGYLWYSLKSTVAQVQDAVSNSATLEYGEIQTPILGPIGVTKISYRPHGFNQTVNIGSVLIRWNEPTELLDLIQAFYKGTLPERLRLSVNRVHVPMEGDIAAWWDEQRGVDLGIPVSVPDSMFGCGAGIFSSADLRSLGYGTLFANLRFEYNYRRGSNEVTFYSSMRAQEMMTFTFEGSIPSSGISLSLRSIGSALPKLANVSISYDDESYNKRKISMCAKRSGTSEEQYVESHIQGILTDLKEYRLYPSTELIDAYRTYLVKPAKLTVNLNPYEPLEPSIFAKFDHTNFIDWLGIEIVSDETPVKELVRQGQPEVVEVEQAEAVQQHEEKFQSTPIEQLPEHVNRLARVRTKQGRTHYAYVERVDVEELVLSQHLVGGSTTFSVNLADISEVSVLY